MPYGSEDREFYMLWREHLSPYANPTLSRRAAFATLREEFFLDPWNGDLLKHVQLGKIYPIEFARDNLVSYDYRLLLDDKEATSMTSHAMGFICFHGFVPVRLHEIIIIN